jgi:hypothetical protein
MGKIIVVDSGRSFVKSLSVGTKDLKINQTKIFQAAMAELPGDGFNLNIKPYPDDLWVKYENQNYLLGSLAVRQRPDSAIQDRNPDKTNRQNKIQIITACSLHTDRTDEIILLTNCPARDWKKQKPIIENYFRGYQKIEHRAGDMSEKTTEFFIERCHALPEGEIAYYGYCYDTNLKEKHTEVLSTNTLVLDIGDETVNYISMNPGGEPYDAGSGSLNLGMHNAFSELQNWLEQNGVEITQAALVDRIIVNAPIMRGNRVLDYQEELAECYKRLEVEIYNQLNSRLKFTKYQYLIVCGGGSTPLKNQLRNRYERLLNVICEPGAQMYNCFGAYVLYQLTRG